MNPLAHFDLVGTLMLLFFKFGWAKPVPIDPRYFSHPHRDLIFVSLAGILGNLLTAIVLGLVVRFFPQVMGINFALSEVIFWFIWLNLSFAMFNLIPIPPLDGSKLLYPLLPPQCYKYTFQLERYGTYILLILVLFDAFSGYLYKATSMLFHLITGYYV